jgi:hydroxyacylglutathione hydrolase
MKTLLCTILLILFQDVTFSQNALQMEGNIVFSNDDVVFHQIDEHTWVGTGHEMANESLYLVEGSDRAVLIDAGTNIKDLDKKLRLPSPANRSCWWQRMFIRTIQALP